MKILVGVTYYIPHLSGLTLYAEKLNLVLKSLNHEVTVLTTRHSPDLTSRESGPVNIVRLTPHFKLSKSLVSFALPREIARLVPPSDLVILHLPALESVLIAVISKIFRKPLLSIHHCDPIVPGKIGLLFTLFATLSNFVTCFLSDRIVTYTRDYQDHSPVLKFFKHKTTIILPTVHLGSPNQKIVNQIKSKLPAVEFNIGFAGRISQDKGIAVLLNAIPFLKESLKSFQLVIAGPTHPIGESYFSSLKDLISEYSGSLVFLDSLAPHEMVNFYKNIDCLVLPSVNRTESFGMVQAEALLASVPVIASDLPGVRETVRLTGGGVRFPPRDSQSLARAIAYVLKNPKKFKAHHLSLFSPASFKENYASLLEKMTG